MIGSGGGASPITPQVARPANVVSMNPATYVVGGLVDDVDVEIIDARFCYYDYGKGGEQYLFLGVSMKDADDKVHDQYYSAGDKDFFEPSVEGFGGEGLDRKGGWLVPKGNRTALSQGTNSALFMSSLVKESFPVDRLEQLSITEALVGTVMHVLRQAQPKRKGLIKTGAAAGGGEEREKDILLCSKILSLPGQAKVALGKSSGNGASTGSAKTVASTIQTAAATGTSSASATAAGHPAFHDEAEMALMEIVMEAGGQISKKDLAVKAFQKLIGHPNKKELVPYMYSEPFLSSATGMTFDGGIVKIA